MSTNTLSFSGCKPLAALGIFCAILGLVHPALSIGFLGNLVLFLLSIRYPMLTWKVLLFFSLVFCFLIPHALNFVLTWELLITLASGIAYSLYQSPQALTPPPYKLGIAIALFCAWSILTALFSMNHISSLKEISRYLLSFGVFILYLSWITSEFASQALKSWLYSALLAGPFLLMIFIGHKAGLEIPKLGDLSGQITSLGWTLSTLLTITSSLFIASWRDLKFRHFCFLVFLAASLYLSVSRASYLAALLGIFIILWDITSPRIRRILFIAGLFAAALTFAVFLAADKESLFNTLVRNLSGRNFLWKAALKAAAENPWTGIGPGCWHLWLTQNYISVDFLLADRHGNSFILSPEMLGGEAHNLFFTKIAEMGYLSTPLILTIFLTWGFAASRALRRISHPAHYALSRGCFAAVCSMMLYSLLENGPIIGRGRGVEVFLLWFIAAIPFAAARWQNLSLSVNFFLPRFLQLRPSIHSAEVCP